MASPPAAPGMPSAYDFALILSEELWSESGEVRGRSEAVNRIFDLIRPAFEAKDAEIERLRAENIRLALELRDRRLLSDGHRQSAEEHLRDRLNAESRAVSAEAKLAQAVEVLEPFVQAFDAAREAHGRRYGNDEALGLANFDKMPDRWPMDHLKFDMGTFRRARSASAAARG